MIAHIDCWAYVFGHFFPIGLKCFMVAQETIIYRLVMINPSYNGYFPFLGHFSRETSMTTTHAPNGLGPPNPTKWPTGWRTFWVHFFHEIMLLKFLGVNPPPSWDKYQQRIILPTTQILIFFVCPTISLSLISDYCSHSPLKILKFPPGNFRIWALNFFLKNCSKITIAS